MRGSASGDGKEEWGETLSLPFVFFLPITSDLAFPSVSRTIQIERTGDESANTDLKVAVTSSVVSEYVATGDKEGHGNKLEKLWPAFSSFYVMPA